MKEIDFGYLPEEYSQLDQSNIFIIPVAYDGTSTWIKGADKGPQAMLEASANMELYDIETDSEVYNHGIFTESPIAGDITTREMIQAVSDAVKYCIDENKLPVVLGGEHSVSIGAIKTMAANYENLTVLQLDAHADLRDEYEGSKYNHACVMARAKECCPIVQVGIRSISSEELSAVDTERVFFAEDINDNTGWIENIPPLLSDNVYITIDLDAFDPAIMPSTGTPEPGGLSWYPVLKLMKKIAETKNIVGFDVVELCPSSENVAPDFMAAKLVYKILSYIFKNRE